MKAVLAGGALVLGCALASGLGAQEPAPAEAYGIYRAPDSARADSAPADSAPADSAPVVGGPAGGAQAEAAPDTGDAPRQATDTIGLEVIEVADDTSLTARMDVWRGGGLRRDEFPDLRESAALIGRYTVFLSLIRGERWGAALGDTARVTVLAPTDSAFAALPAAALERLRSDSATRARWAGTVLLAGDRSIGALLEAGDVETMTGTVVQVTRGADGWARVGEARVVQPDLIARNGMLQGVDRVTMPDTTGPSPTSAVP